MSATGRKRGGALKVACGLWLSCCSGPQAEPELRAPPIRVSAALPLACPFELGDCDGRRDNGCEQSLSEPDHCGACGHACAQGSECLAARCRDGFVQLAAGGSHTCARTAAGELWCFGLSAVAQLGLQTRSAQLRPVRVPDLSDVVDVVAGRYFTCVRRASGEVGCFGDHGQLGTDPALQSARPLALPAAHGAVRLTAGANHACALQGDGRTAHCWGGNVRGQLGDGVTTEFQLAPVQVRGLAQAQALAAGNAHTCALLAGGRVACWGMNAYGQLGDGTREDRPTPVMMPGLDDAVRVAPGEFHTCVRRKGGAVACVGRNDRGQLGDGTHTDHLALVTVDLPPVRALAIGERHGCACTRDGALHCFGDNHFGQLGLGPGPARPRPARVALQDKCIHVAAGAAHTCVLLEHGAVRCFGLNDGQLGDGTTTTRATPVAVRF